MPTTFPQRPVATPPTGPRPHRETQFPTPTTTSPRRHDPSNVNVVEKRKCFAALMSEMPPDAVLAEVVRYLASQSGLSGSPLTMMHNEYLRFIECRDALEYRDLAPAKVLNRALRGLRVGGEEDDVDAPVALHVMDNTKTSLRDVHSQLLALHEAYRLLAAESHVKDKKIMRLQADLSQAHAHMEVLQRGITSAQVVHASAVDDADLLSEAQKLNAQLADEIAAYEDNMDAGGAVNFNEMLDAIQLLTRENESLIQRNSALSSAVLEADEIVAATRATVKEQESKITLQEQAIRKLTSEVELMRDECAISARL